MALMAALIILLFFLSGAASGLHVVTVNPGDNVILKVDAGNDSIVVEWTRDDLKSKYVLLYRDGHPDTDNQHSSFKDRVELVESKMDNKNFSIILKNVSREDNGTYRCRVVTGRSSRTKRGILKSDPINTIRLEVRGSGNGDPKTDDTMTDDPKTDDPGNEDFPRGYVGLGAAAAGVGGVVCSVGLILVRKSKKHPDNRSERSAADEAAVHQLM